MRTAGISYRDCALVAKTVRAYDISHAAIQRHEVEKHFDPAHVVASQTPIIDPGELTIKTIVDRKIKLYWQAHGDAVPSDGEIRNWLKLWAELRQADAETEKAKVLREMFRQPALPAPKQDIIEGEIITDGDN